MREIESVLIVGAGAVGSAVAATIEASRPGLLQVLADGVRYLRYAADGFTVNGRRYSFPLVRPQEGRPVDLVILATKHHQLESALGQLANFIGPDTIILSLLNGIVSEEIIARRYAPCPLAYIIGIDAVRAGTDVRFASTGRIVFGERRNIPGAWSPRVSSIARFLDSVGYPREIPEDMVRAQWFKFMINVGINQASALLKAPYGRFIEDADARAVMELAMREVVTLAQAKDIGLTEQDMVSWQNTLLSLDPEGQTSMLQDVLAERKTEVEIFAGSIVAMGKELGIPTPVNQLMLHQLRALEATFSR